MGEVTEPRTCLIDRSSNSAGCFGVIAMDAFANALQVLGGGPPSGPQDAFQALPDLLVGQVLAALQRRLAALHRFEETAFLVEIP